MTTVDFLSTWHHLHQTALNQTIPVISIYNALFLKRLLLQYRPRRVLEIGTAVGISGSWIAHHIASWNGHLTTLEISELSYNGALNTFKRLNLHNIDAHYANAHDWLAKHKGSLTFDLIFIDGQKSRTLDFYTQSLPLLNLNHHPKGHNPLIIIDDAWKFRDKMKPLYDYLNHTKQTYSLHFIDFNIKNNQIQQEGDATLLVPIKAYTL